MASSDVDASATPDELERALEVVGADVRVAPLLMGLVNTGAMITLRDDGGMLTWDSAAELGLHRDDDLPERARPVRVFDLGGRELSLSDGPGYHARIAGRVEASRILGLRSGDEPVRWVKISSLPITSGEAGWSVISIAFDVADLFSQEFTSDDAVLAGEAGPTARAEPHSFVKLEDALEAVGVVPALADLLFRLGDAGNLITIRNPRGDMEWTSGNIWTGSVGAGQPHAGGHAARYLTAAGREMPMNDQGPQRARRSGTAEPAAVVGLLLNGELRWVMLAAVPMARGDDGCSVITVGIDMTSIAGREGTGGLPELP